METMYQYLYRTGILPYGSQGEVERGKVKYRKLYKQAKQREYAQTRKRVELTFDLKEHIQFQKEAKKAKQTIPTYLRKAIDSARKNQVFLPDDSKLHDLQMEIRRIGNNINQMAYYANRNKSISASMIRAAQDYLNEIEELIIRSFKL